MSPIAKVLIFDSEKNLLILRRSLTHPRWPHGIDFPGGNTDPGETVEEASVREVFEEAGLKVDKDDLNLVFQRTMKGRNQLVFSLDIKGTKPPVKVSWEHDAYFWVKPSELPEYKDKVDDSFYQSALIALGQHPK